MSVAQHTIRRGGTYHLRCRVPFDLVAVLGRSEIHRSLGTACPKEGKRRAIRLYGLFVDIFDGVRVMAETKEEWLAQLAAMDAKSRADRIGELFDLATLCVKELEQERALREKRDGQIREMGEHLGYFIGQLADSVSPERLALLEHWKATFSALTRDRDDLKRQRDELADSATVAQGMEQVSALARLLGLPSVSATTPTVSQFLNDTYAKERRLADDSHRHITNFISLFAKITGDKRLADYTRTDVVDYVRTLERLSRSTGKSPEDKTASIKRLLEKSAGKPTMNATTIGKHVQHVKGFFNTARKHLNFTTSDTIDQMFDGIDLSDFVPSIQKRKIWPIDKLNALFNTPIWQGTSSAPDDFTKRHKAGSVIHRDAYWWLPVVALWTGARLEELAQLHHEDLGTDRNGIAFIRIHDDGIRRVKTANSIRDIPVHSDLIRFGFLDLFDPKKVGNRIWPELQATGRMKKFGDTYSTHFTDYRRRCEVYEPLMDFHSLRRTFITSMRMRANVDPLSVAALAGHDEELPIFKRMAQTNDYTEYDVCALHKKIEALDYESYGLNLDLIMKRPFNRA